MELFTGAGGLALGVSMAGFKHEILIESEPNACATIRDNIKRGLPHVVDWRLHEGDVRGFDFSTIRDDIDLLAAGVPCQPFSIAGGGLGQYDERNMFPEAVRAIVALRPKAVLIENVKGLLRPNFREYMDFLCLEISFPEISRQPNEEWKSHYKRLQSLAEKNWAGGLRYHVYCHVLNAADYGVPQWRERVFIVAFRSDIAVDWSPPAPSHSMDALLWSQWRTGDYWESHGLTRKKPGILSHRFAQRLSQIKLLKQLGGDCAPWRTVRDAISDLPQLCSGETSPHDPNHFMNPGARGYARHTGSLLDEPAKTLKAGVHGVPGGENTLAIGGGRVRYFSVRECARLQTFPDDYVFSGQWSRTMRQVGNAVPVRLAECMARRICQLLEESRDSSAQVWRGKAADLPNNKGIDARLRSKPYLRNTHGRSALPSRPIQTEVPQTPVPQGDVLGA